MRLTPLIVAAALAATACGEAHGPAATAASSPSTTTAAGTTPLPREERPPPDSLPEPVPPPEAPAVTGEVPDDLLGAVTGDLAVRTGVPAASITVLGGRATVWPDGSLGCPVPGEAYTQAPVPGFHIVLDAGGDTYDYRAAETGWFRLCSP